jgi:hypothetical protein
MTDEILKRAFLASQAQVRALNMRLRRLDAELRKRKRREDEREVTADLARLGKRRKAVS